MDALQLNRAPPSKFVIEMLPRTAERLPRPHRFFAQPIAMRAGGHRQQLLVEVVAVGGDDRQQRRQRDRRIVPAGRIAARAGGHQDRAGQDGRRLIDAIDRIDPWRAVPRIAARQQRVERHLLQHEPRVVARAGNMVRVPLSEVVVRSTVDGVVEIVGPRVEGDFLQPIEIEPGPRQDFGIGLVQNLDRPRDDRRVATGGDAGPADEQRDRPHELMGVRFAAGARLQAWRSDDSRRSRSAERWRRR